MAFPRPSSPRVLLADLRAFLAERSRHQVIAAALAIVIPAFILVGFYVDSRDVGLPKEQIVYAQSWRADRSDDEIVAQQKIDQESRKQRQAERQRQFKELERRFGL